MRNFVHRTCRVPREISERIDAEAARAGCTPTEFMREAIERRISEAQILTESSRRHLRVTEYMQLALDTIIRRQHPDIRDKLIEEANRRMEMHHGA